MEELKQTAKSYYQHAADDVKSMAKNFLDSLDHDKDGKVSLEEFLSSMQRKSYIKMANREFFKELNISRTGKLDFWEVMTLFYIIHSGRQFCDGCGKFMKRLYFTCVRCFELKDTTFSVCPSCFQEGKYVHHHHVFLDNHILLETKRLANLKKVKELAEKESKARREGKVTPSSAACNAIVVANKQVTRSNAASNAPNTNRRQGNAGSGTPTTSREIVRYDPNPRNDGRLLERAARVVADISLKAAQVASVLGCSIM